jgi:phage protein D
MEIYYQGVEISQYMPALGCVCREAATGRADTLEIEFDHAAIWHRWKPETDDVIRVVEGAYDTGDMYVCMVTPGKGRYRIVASGMPEAARRRAWRGYADMTLETIIQNLASESGMKSGLYGIDGGIRYPYLLRRNESCAALLARIGGLEGFFVKTYGGAIRCVGIEYAQGMDAAVTMEITPEQEGARWTRAAGRKIRSLTVCGAYVSATAMDAGAETGIAAETAQAPAADAATAGRWARGMLLTRNRRAERLTLDVTEDARLRALTRISITGGTGADGEWLIDECEHDLTAMRCRAELARVISTIR